MKAYVVCKQGAYNTFKPGAIVPKLWLYMTGYEVKTTGGGAWSVCIVEDAATIPAGAQSDPDIFVFDTEAELDTVLTNQKRNTVNSQLAKTTWAINGTPITAVSGDTVRIVLDKIRQAMNHSAESWGLGL